MGCVFRGESGSIWDALGIRLGCVGHAFASANMFGVSIWDAFGMHVPAGNYTFSLFGDPFGMRVPERIHDFPFIKQG